MISESDERWRLSGLAEDNTEEPGIDEINWLVVVSSGEELTCRPRDRKPIKLVSLRWMSHVYTWVAGNNCSGPRSNSIMAHPNVLGRIFRVDESQALRRTFGVLHTGAIDVRHDLLQDGGIFGACAK